MVVRLALAFGLLSALLTGLSSVILYRSLARAAWRDDAEDVQHASSVVARRMDLEGGSDGDALDVEAGVLIQVRQSSGRTLIASRGLPDLDPSAFPGPGERPASRRAQDGSEWITASAAWRGGTVLAAKNLGGHARLLDSYQDTLLATSLLVALLAAGAGWWIARKGLAPLDRLAEAASGIRPGTLDRRIDPRTGPAELARLVESLNGALDRLEEAFSRLSALNSDMAHELRTPIHALRLELESLSASASPESGERLGAAVESLDHMGALVEQMLFLARAEDPATALSLDSLDLSLTLSEAVRPFEPLAEERGLELLVLAPGGLTLRADPILLRRALHNLLANALRHTREGTISLTAGEHDGAIWIEVRDTGEGISPGLLPRLGQRFLRGDESRDRASGGTGLGLAIVQSILRLHGGRLEVASEPGQGTRARLVFPRTGRA